MKPVRKRNDSRIKVSVRTEERDRIENFARSAGLSVSSYLRVTGLKQEPRSALDRQSVLELAQVNADQGRLGGLLKLWIAEKPGQGASIQEVRRILREIEAFQKGLRSVLERL